MKKAFYTFLSRPVTTVMFFFSVIVVGIVAILNLPVELSPHVEYPRLSVSVSWAGVSPEAVEAHLTSPIEAELTTIMGVRKISSTSSEGFSNITIDFHPDTDINFARIEINEKLTALKNELPVGISPPRISPYIPKDFQELQGFLTYSVSSGRSANEVRKFLIDNVQLQLKAVDGVSNVEVRGGSDRIVEIIVDYNKVKGLGITNEEINNAIEEAEVILSAGKIRDKNTQVFINVKNEIENPDVIGAQVIKRLSNGQSIRIKDVAIVSDDFKEPQTYYRINNKETVTLIISKELGANTFKVASDVESRLNELSKNFPPDYTLVKEIDKSEDMSKDLDSLYRDGSYSFLILFLVLLLIFRNLKYPVIIITSIFFSLFFSFALFYLFNLSLNIITIACFIIGLGFIVDNSIVVLDYLDRHYTGRGIKQLAIFVKEIFSPLFTSTITIIAVFIPLIFLTGELKLYFRQFALGIGSTLSASLIVSITVVPLLYLKTFRQKKEIKLLTVFSQFANNIYVTIVKTIIRFKKLSIVFLVLVIGLPVWLIPNRIETPYIRDIYNPIFESEFYYEMKPYINYALGGSLNLFFNHVSRGELWKYGEETYIYIRLELPNGNRIDRINKLCNELENDIIQYKNNFKNLIANVINEETATLRVEFDEKQANTAFPFILKNYVTAYATRLGGVNSYVYGFGPGFSNAGGGSSSMFNVVVKGFNYERVKALAEDFRTKLIRNPRIDNVDIDKSAFFWSPEVYEVIGKIDREKLTAYNISINELFLTIAKNSGGNFTHNKFRIKNDEVEYQVKFSNYNDVQLEELKNIIVSDSRRNSIKIKDLIDFNERKVLSSINREDQQYVRYISFEFKGPYKYGQKFLEASLLSLNVPEGYNLKPADFFFLFGDKDELDILLVFIASLIIIFMISSSLFESLKKPLIIILAIPFALVGAVFLFWLLDFNIERGAYSGMLLLIGLSVSNSIMLVNYLTKNRRFGTVDELLILSGTRLRAILTTSLTTIFALLPFILNTESSFWKNLSLSIAGGIMTSSIFVALFIPFVYYIFLGRK
ncbi:MAG: efflux RND transporter permease subunit [Melioribacteraceae bacterium]|nr:efflux RND transporter permease subunit [Melioribacteraceae bacterium]